jgi:polyhydroxyalkanoate synthesis regulator phasin
MNPDTLMQSLQTSFRATVGAASTALESLQDAQKREENLQALQNQDWEAVVQRLAEKGEITELEARRFVDELLGSQSPDGPRTVDVTGEAEESTAEPATEEELEALSEMVASLRQELEQLRNSQSDE